MQKIALLLALGVASFTVAEWTFPSQLSIDQGMFGGDTTWYHMPFSGRIAQDASIVHLHFTDPLRLAAWFYPGSSELVHAAGIVLFESDWLSPLINLIFLSIALLAAWCIGRPYKVGPATLVAAAIVLDAGVMIETQPGEGRNDIMGLAFLLAFIAFLINGHQRRAPAEGTAVQDTPERDAPLLDKGPLVIAGISAGLAASVKYTFLIPIVAIGIGVVVFSGKGRRFTTAWVLGLSTFLIGGYWYVRAVVKTGGNPIPYSGFGPLHLPQPDQMPLDPRPRFAVADYLTEPTIYRKWFFPELDNAFGPLWPLILILALAAAVYLVVRSRNRIVRVLAAGALATAVVYLFTPLTAAGQEGSPTGFFTNTRYLVPGLIMALTLLPIARPLRAPDAARVADALLPDRRLRDHGADDAALVSRASSSARSSSPSAWSGRRRASLAARAHAASPAPRSRSASRRCFSSRCFLGRAQEVQYYDQHYSGPRPFLQDGGPKDAYGFAQPPERQADRDRRLRRDLLRPVRLLRKNLDNHVQYIGVPGENGTYRLPMTCRGFIRQINDGDYDYLILSQFTMDWPLGPYQTAGLRLDQGRSRRSRC